VTIKNVNQTVSLQTVNNSKLETANSKLFRYRRRIVTIHGKSLVGLSVLLKRLSAIIEGTGHLKNPFHITKHRAQRLAAVISIR
jgi:hypothetical protein